jgi:ATP adenylyltransferase
VPDNLFDTPVQAAGWLTIHYQKLLNQTKVKLNGTAAFTGYNLLLTREWLMLVPRRKEAVAGISFNALAFCGSILVKNREQRDQLIEIGVSRALHEITE